MTLRVGVCRYKRAHLDSAKLATCPASRTGLKSRMEWRSTFMEWRGSSGSYREEKYIKLYLV